MRIPKLIIAAFVLTNLSLIGACLFALKENVGLRRAVAYDEALLTPAKGEAMPPLLGTDWTGAPQTVDYGQDPRPTIVYTFSKECSYCQENWRAMRSFQALSPRRLRIVYIDTTGDLLAPTYLAANGIEQSSLLIRLSTALAYVYDARATPQILLIGHDGRVQWSHVGELGRSDLSEVLSLIQGD
jgi:hypothetical protein